MGFGFSEYLAKTVRAKLMLTVNSDFPDRKKWKKWLETHDEQDGVSRRILKALSLEQLGAKVIVARADVGDYAQMRAVVDLVQRAVW